MDVQVKIGRIEREQAEAIIVSHFEGSTELLEETKAVDKALHGRVRELLSTGEFLGRLGQTSLLHTTGQLSSPRCLLVGLGKASDFTPDRIRQALGKASRVLRDLGARSFAATVAGSGQPAPPQAGTRRPGQARVSPREAARCVAEGIILGLYQFTDYRTEKREEIKVVEKVTLVERKQENFSAVRGGAHVGQILAESTNFVRDLGNHPANVVTPSRMAKVAREEADKCGFECRIFDKDAIEKEGMGAFLGVARGSQEPPKLILLEYFAGSPKVRPIALVGKTITFDSGGISLKPSEKMEQMKGDMSGGAAVLGAIRAASLLKLPVSVVGILPATENMPSGSAIKPGDVVTTMSGKTVEVINTDAEGRLALADGLTYVTRYQPEAIVDIATLTGACVVALGNHAIGLLGNNPSLLSRLKQAGEMSGERVWELPLWEDYSEQIKSEIADMKNVGGREGGTITAAAFLSRFSESYPWAHLDIAGTAWSETEKPYLPKGATGVGVRLLVDFLSSVSGGLGGLGGTSAKQRKEERAPRRTHEKRPKARSTSGGSRTTKSRGKKGR